MLIIRRLLKVKSDVCDENNVGLDRKKSGINNSSDYKFFIVKTEKMNINFVCSIVIIIIYQKK